MVRLCELSLYANEWTIEMTRLVDRATTWLPTRNRISLLRVFHALFYRRSSSLQGICFLIGCTL